MSQQVVPAGQEWKIGVKQGIEQVLGKKAIAMDLSTDNPGQCMVFMNECTADDITRLHKKIGYHIHVSASSMVNGNIKYLMIMLLIIKAA